MIEYTAAEKIKETIENGVEVVMRASLTIANSDNDIQISLLYSSSLDLDAESMKSFTELALESAKMRKKALLDLRIHTFSCMDCSPEVKKQTCISNGKYCTFFPRIGDITLSNINSQNYAKNLDIYNQLMNESVNGRDILMSTLTEKCYHEEIKKSIASKLNTSENNSVADSTGNLDMEQRFIISIVARIRSCREIIVMTSRFSAEKCLFSIKQIQSTLMR